MSFDHSNVLIHKGQTPRVGNLEEGRVYTNSQASVQESMCACIFWNAEHTPNPAFATLLTVFARLTMFYHDRERKK